MRRAVGARVLGLLLALAPLAQAGCGSDDAPPAAPALAGPGPDRLRVMTWNLYLGGDLDPAFAPGADLPVLVELVWASVQATDFAARAKVLADAIAAADPDLLALQEVSLWRTQTPGDHLLVPNATAVALDFLAVLSRELSARALSYRLVSAVQNADIELAGASGTDYRLTDRDVILAKETLPAVGAGAGRYPHLATVTVPSPLGGPPLQASIARGWAAADVRAGGRTIRVVGTHLEAISADVAAAQAADLVAMVTAGPRPAIVLGDMNLPPGSAGYGVFVAPGTRLRDAWEAVRPGDPGLTCCYGADLRGGSLATRIDLVFPTDDLRPVSAARAGEVERTPGGLAPSDHLGVTVLLDPAPASTAAPLAAAAR